MENARAAHDAHLGMYSILYCVRLAFVTAATVVA